MISTSFLCIVPMLFDELTNTMNTQISRQLRTEAPTTCQWRELPTGLQALAKISSFKIGETIYYQDDPADYWYDLMEGAARKSAVMTDGRRHIVCFLLPGDLFGFGALRAHRFSVEAISPRTVVARFPRRRVELLAESDPEVSRKVREAAFESISRLQARMVILCLNGAHEKVAAFLLEMMVRSADDAGVIDLPMSRYDIADHLGIAVETVSRSLTTMRRMRVIAFNGTRHIRVDDCAALKKVVSAVRDAPDLEGVA